MKNELPTARMEDSAHNSIELLPDTSDLEACLDKCRRSGLIQVDDSSQKIHGTLPVVSRAERLTRKPALLPFLNAPVVEPENIDTSFSSASENDTFLSIHTSDSLLNASCSEATNGEGCGAMQTTHM